MKLKKVFIILFLAVTALTTTVHAQNYKTAAGVRLGYENGITLKNFFARSSAFEGILSFSPRYFNLTALYEYQQPIPGARGFDWYVGLGGHIGGINKNKKKDNGAFLIGADLIGGVEYTFPTAPFCVSLDWKPWFNFNDYNDYWFHGFALSLRYRFR